MYSSSLEWPQLLLIYFLSAAPSLPPATCSHSPPFRFIQTPRPPPPVSHPGTSLPHHACVPVMEYCFSNLADRVTIFMYCFSIFISPVPPHPAVPLPSHMLPATVFARASFTCPSGPFLKMPLLCFRFSGKANESQDVRRDP